MKVSDLFLDHLPGAAIYEIEDEIGHGTYSEVHRARHHETGQVVALKHMGFPRQGERPVHVEREIAALRALKGEANIVTLLETHEEDHGISLVLQHCVADLGTLLQQAGGAPLPPAVTKAIMLHLLQALKACHNAGFLHRDVSPYNVLFEECGALRLSDFGQARRCPLGEEDVPLMSPVVGTRWYRAPELLFGSRQHTPAVDLWSAGCIFAELLTGGPLFPGTSDIDQICRVRGVLGSPTLEVWPGVETLPDWGKLVFPPMERKSWSEVVPGADEEALALLDGLLRYDPASRLSAAEALGTAYFAATPTPAGDEGVQQEIKRHMR